MTTPTDRCRLYLITPPAFAITTFIEQVKAALGAGDVIALQLRLKEAEDAEILAAADALQPICTAHDVAFIINDRVDIAKETGADGVHLGEEDGSVDEARATLGPEAIIGASCYASSDRAMTAAEQGADYVAFGAFFPTQTKTPKAMPDPDILTWWSTYTVIPCGAIGGITPKNATPLVKAGADFLAVISSVWEYTEGPAAAVKAFNTLF